MVPLRPASLFRSRWAALFYAAGVLWFAADVAGGKHAVAPQAVTNETGDADGTSPGNDADIAALEAKVHAFEATK